MKKKKRKLYKVKFFKNVYEAVNYLANNKAVEEICKVDTRKDGRVKSKYVLWERIA